VSRELVAQTQPILDPQEPNESLEDELLAGDTRGNGNTLRLLASGLVERTQLEEIPGRAPRVVVFSTQALDSVEVTVALAVVLRRLERLARRVQQHEQRLDALEAAP
jgi:hypothetical protein